LRLVDSFSTYPQVPNFAKILPVGTELFHASRLTDRKKDTTKLEVTFRNFANASENTEKFRILRGLELL